LEILLAGGLAQAMTPEDRLQFADGLYARGLYDLAVKEYQPLLTNEPPVANLDAALFRTGESFRYLSKRQDADAVYARLLQRFPESAYAWRAEFRRAELYVTGGQYDEAVKYLGALVGKSPPGEIAASALYYLGYSHARLNAAKEAAAAYRRVVKDHAGSPFYSYACLGLAELESKSGADAGELRGLYEKAARSPATPRVGAEAWFNLAELAFKQRDYVRASEAYEQLLVRYPSDERAEGARLRAGWSFHNVKRHADALKLAETALARGPDAGDMAEWHYLRANCLRQLQRNGEARDAYARLMKEHADSPLAAASAYEQALVAFQDKDYAAVVGLEGRAAVTNEFAKDFYWMMAESHVALTNPAEAIRNYKIIEDKYPDSDRAPLAFYEHARLLQERKSWEASSDLYRKAAEKDASLAAGALLASAYARNQMKDREEELRDLAALAARQPDLKNMDRVLYQKAQAEVELAKEGDARATLDRMLKAYPRSEHAASAHYLLGVLLEKTGSFDVADYHYRAALAGKPEEQVADQIRFRWAVVLQKQGKNDEAAELLQQVLRTPARSRIPVPLLEWLARYNLDGKKYAEADAAATALAGMTTDPVWKQVAWYIAGRGRQESGKAAEARQAYEQALAVDVKTREGVESALYLAQVALQTSDPAAAETYYARAAEMASGDDMLDIRARSYFGLGEAARARQKWEDASRYFLGVGVLFDDADLTPRSLYYAAEAFGKLNRAEERDKALAELRQRYPDSEWAKK
jgi:TolA-binding protein